jgi:hypothetical protein
MQTNTLIAPEPSAKTKLRLFTLYADFSAGVRAKRMMSRLASLARDWNVSAEMWKLDSIAPVGPIRDMIAQEAGESDVLVIAVSAVNPPDPAVSGWLQTLLPWKTNRPAPGLLLGLLGDEEHKVGEANWLVTELTTFASHTHMDLAWHWVGFDRVEDADWPDVALTKLLDRKRTGERNLEGGMAIVTST